MNKINIWIYRGGGGGCVFVDLMEKCANIPTKKGRKAYFAKMDGNIFHYLS
jgi:hypothetical protein